jgi:hypothetical protein
MVETAVNQGLSASAAVADSRQRARDAAANRTTQERGQDMTAETQRYVADQGLKRTSAQDRAVASLMAEAKAAGTPISEAEALRQYFAMQPSMYSVGQRGDQAKIRTRQGVSDAVYDTYVGQRNIGLRTPEQAEYDRAVAAGNGPQFLEDKINERMRIIMASDAGASAGATQSVDVSRINPEAIEMLKGNPSEQNRAFFDAEFGAGSAAAALGQ